MIIYTDKPADSMDNYTILVTSKNFPNIKDTMLRDICKSLRIYNNDGIIYSMTGSTTERNTRLQYTERNTRLQYIFYLNTSDEDVLRKDVDALIRTLKRAFCDNNVIIPYKFNIELSDALWKNVVIPSLIKAYINHKPVIYIQTDRDSSVLFKQEDCEDDDCLC